MTFINFIKQFFKKPKITIRIIVNKKELNIKAKFLDNLYQLPQFNEVRDFINNDNLSFKKYRKEYFDCDDFAIILWGRLREQFQGCAVGFALSGTHAFNVFIDDKRKMWIIEPQTDKIFKYDNNPKYKIKTLII